MRLMPGSRTRPDTLRFFRHGALGLPALGDALVDDYTEGADHLTLVLLRAADEPAAGTLFERVLEQLAVGTGAVSVPALGQQASVADSPANGLCYVLRQDRYVAAAVNVHDRATAEGLLAITATNIRLSRF